MTKREYSILSCRDSNIPLIRRRDMTSKSIFTVQFEPMSAFLTDNPDPVDFVWAVFICSFEISGVVLQLYGRCLVSLQDGSETVHPFPCPGSNPKLLFM